MLHAGTPAVKRARPNSSRWCARSARASARAGLAGPAVDLVERDLVVVDHGSEKTPDQPGADELMRAGTRWVHVPVHDDVAGTPTVEDGPGLFTREGRQCRHVDKRLVRNVVAVSVDERLP